jgi:GNAT superfamily N-acetyltransferase
MEIRALTTETYPDASDLFNSSSTTRGCWCMWFLLSSSEVDAGWGDGNRREFSKLAGQDPPGGVMAYRDGKPVGWCAAGPRSRYRRAMRSRILAGRDPAEDDSVWLVPCFFVRTGARQAGLTRELLTAAVELARDHGATAVEGFPLAGSGPHSTDRYLGTEPLFSACGFTTIARPSPRRVVMRLELTSPGRTGPDRTGRDQAEPVPEPTGRNRRRPP